MKFKIGDRVKFLNDVGYGIIVNIKNKNVYEVKNEEGFDVPVYESELILIDNDKSNKTTPNKTTPNKTNDIQNNDSKDLDSIDEINFGDDYNNQLLNNDTKNVNLFLALVPENEDDILNSNLCAFFINDSSFFAIVVIKTFKNKQYHLIKTINIEPDTKIKVFDINRQKLNNYNKLFVQVILYKKISKYHLKTFDKKVVIKANKIYSLNSYKENDYTEKKAILFSVDKIDKPDTKQFNDIKKVLNQKIKSDLQPVAINKNKKKERKSDTLEVDLHIGELLDDYRGMSNFEILSIQISEAKKQMEKAILDKEIRKVVFIHGVGEGTLKFELRKVLDKEYARFEYQDASFERYGFGATMVIIR